MRYWRRRWSVNNYVMAGTIQPWAVGRKHSWEIIFFSMLFALKFSLFVKERERERGSAPSLRERRHIGWCFSSHSWAFLYSYVHYTCSHLTPLCWDTRIPIACLIIYSSRVFKVTWDLLVWATSDCLNSNTLHSSWLGGSCHYILFSKLQDCYIHLQFHVDVYALSIFIWQTYKTSTMHYQIYNTKWLVLFQKKKTILLSPLPCSRLLSSLTWFALLQKQLFLSEMRIRCFSLLLSFGEPQQC